MIPPPEATPLLAVLAPAFTRPIYRRFVTLLLAAVLTTGPRTAANLLRTLGGLAPGHRTDYQCVLSSAPWPALGLSCAPAGFIITHLVPDGTVVLVVTIPSTATPARRLWQGPAPRPGPLNPQPRSRYDGRRAGTATGSRTMAARDRLRDSVSRRRPLMDRDRSFYQNM